jgi:hypothetical protein
MRKNWQSLRRQLYRPSDRLGRSVGIVRSRTQTMELVCFVCLYVSGTHLCYWLSKPQGLERPEELGKFKNSPYLVSDP